MNWLWPFSTVFLLFLVPIYSSYSFTADLFENWCKQYGKTYSSEQEKQYRLGIFEDNYDYISQHNNLANSTYTLSLNAFADLTHEEFKARYLGLSSSANDLIRLNPRRSPFRASGVDSDIPPSVDWRKSGAVTDVKDQGSCGACWAFSTTGAIEGINKIVTGSLISLSEQELIDCDRSYNSGCGGGLMDYAYKFVIKNNGIDSEEDYPFLGHDGTCKKNKLKRSVVTIDGYVDVPPNSEEALLQAVAKQPVSVGICGSDRRFQLYSSGVFTGPCSSNLDHAVLIVGYESKNGLNYWIVKNSWGTSWGMNGHMHLARDSSKPEGVCGINMLASYPVKTGPNPVPGPPSPPKPDKCNIFFSCPSGSTCCCAFRFLICWSWKCCRLESAVCCKDGHHCCPQDYPVCDLEKNLCYKKTNSTLATQLENNGVYRPLESWNPFFQNWNL